MYRYIFIHPYITKAWYTVLYSRHKNPLTNSDTMKSWFVQCKQYEYKYGVQYMFGDTKRNSLSVKKQYKYNRQVTNLIKMTDLFHMNCSCAIVLIQWQRVLGTKKILISLLQLLPFCILFWNNATLSAKHHSAPGPSSPLGAPVGIGSKSELVGGGGGGVRKH